MPRPRLLPEILEMPGPKRLRRSNTQVFADSLSARGGTGPAGDRNHRRDGWRGWPPEARRRNGPGPVLRRGIAEQNAAVLMASGIVLPGRQAGLRHLLDLPATGLRPDRPRRLPPGARRPSRWTGPGWSGMTGRPTMVLPSTSPTSARSPNVAAMARATRRCWSAMLHTAIEYDGRLHCVIRAGAAEGVEIPAARS